jgi:hypothetical protein
VTHARLILIKHSLPEMVPGLPANRWHLSGAGRLRCQALAEQLAPYHPDVIVASAEPKAAETAKFETISRHITADSLDDEQGSRLAGRVPRRERPSAIGANRRQSK